MKGETVTEASCLAIIDGQYLFAVRNSLKDIGVSNVKMDYKTLKRLLEKAIIEKIGFRKSEKTIVVCSVYPGSEGQVMFVDSIKALGYDVHAVDYWRTYILPPGLTQVSDQSKRNNVYTLSPLISYMIGLLSCRPNPQVIVVSGSFGLCDSLIDFTENHNGKAAVIFFQKFLDPRWGIVGFSDKLRFYDLEQHSEELLGIDLIKIAKKSAIEI